MKIIEIADTRWHVFKLKCTKFYFGWGAYSAPPDPLAGFKGPTSNGCSLAVIYLVVSGLRALDVGGGVVVAEGELPPASRGGIVGPASR